MNKITGLTLITLFSATMACNNSGNSSADKPATAMNIKEETFSYSADSVTMNGFAAWNDADSAKRPIVLIVHEWWGLNDYIKSRTLQLAKLGYFAMAVDLYGNGVTADNPEKAQKLAMPFYQNPQMAKARFDAALAKAKSFPAADAGKVAAIGYCFGGGMVLNVARLGEDLAGVVSFHGNLVGVPADKNLLKSQILVCYGDSDKFVPQSELAQFSHQMDSIGAKLTVKHYANATHAFTNPVATETGKKFSLPIAYNAEADTASFNDMLAFFQKIFK